MSMINQMLKDLDSRQTKASDAQPTLTDVRLSSSTSRKFVKPVVLVVVALAIVFGLFARFRQASGPIQSAVVVPAVVTVPAQPVPVASAPSASTLPVNEPVATMTTPAPSLDKTIPGPAASAPPDSQLTANVAVEDSPERALQRWLAAYSSADSKAYFDSYATNFTPSNGVSPDAWKQQRRNFFAGGKKAKIEITDVRIETNGTTAQTHFHQRFRSQGYNDEVKKTLSWQLIAGKWLIVAENVQPQTLSTRSTQADAVDAAGGRPVEVSDKAVQKSAANRTPGIKSVNPKQLSANLYRDAVIMVQGGKLTDAQEVLSQALEANEANHNARQMLADLLVDAGRRREATALLSNGLNLAPAHSGFCMALARLHLASGAKQEALVILQQGLANAGDDGEYHGFLAALLQTFGRHDEAIKHYVIALRSDPSMPTWLVGIGISLRAQKKLVDAAEAFQRALDTGELSAEVADFARLQIDQIRRSR